MELKASTIERLLSSGGDDRLLLSDMQIRTNKYYCSYIARPDIIRRGSSTCSSIDQTLFSKVAMNPDFAELLDGERPSKNCYDILSFGQSLIDRLKSTLKIHKMSEIIMFPSGSDAEFLPLIVGVLRSFNIAGNIEGIHVDNFVVAAGEVGSGTALASAGKHFSSVVPSLEPRKCGDLLKGMESSWVDVHAFKPRNDFGTVDFQEAMLAEEIKTKLRASESNVVVLHVVHGSKTGLMYPSEEFLQKLQDDCGTERLLIVVDSCQFRTKLSAIRAQIEKGYMCLVTGSKYFTGPAFAGAVVLPNSFATMIETYLTHYLDNSASSRCLIPVGLLDYLTPAEAPSSMPSFRRFLNPDNHYSEDLPVWSNYGLQMRWYAALHRIESYSALDERLVDSFVSEWEEGIRRLVRAQWPYLEVVEDACCDSASKCSGIISIAVRVPEISANGLTVRNLSLDEAKDFHRLMAEENSSFDCSFKTRLPKYSHLTSIKAMIGQPVLLIVDRPSKNGLSVLRIALGADMVLDALNNTFSNHPADVEESSCMYPSYYAARERIREEDRAVVEKMAYLVRHWGETQYESESADQGCCSAFKDCCALHMRMRDVDSKMRLGTGHLHGKGGIVTAAHVGRVVAGSYFPKVAVFYDLDALQYNIDELTRTFAAPFITAPADRSPWLHCFAVKSCPLSYILHRVLSNNFGLETASINEVKQALRCHCSPDRIVFDSPCKTAEDLEFALRFGVRINANSYHEVSKIADVLEHLRRQGIQSSSSIGLRVNPMVGSGKIGVLSTATESSKFGVLLYSKEVCAHVADCVEGLVDYSERILETYERFPFLSGIMCHVGSQGMHVNSMAQGAARILKLADMIDARSGPQKNEENGTTTPRIRFVDIGGGLPANYDDDSVSPTFLEYISALLEICPDFVESTRANGRILMTEFGKAIIAKCGTIATRVEDVLMRDTGMLPSAIAITHAGADMLVRTAYSYDKFPHRVALVNAEGKVLATSAPHRIETGDSTKFIMDGALTDAAQGRQQGCVTVSGPLCFSGDIIAKDMLWPIPDRSDIVLIQDAGANTLSLFSRHCSRCAPAVFVYRQVDIRAALEHRDFVVCCVKQEEHDEEVLQFWD